MVMAATATATATTTAMITTITVEAMHGRRGEEAVWGTEMRAAPTLVMAMAVTIVVILTIGAGAGVCGSVDSVVARDYQRDEQLDSCRRWPKRLANFCNRETRARRVSRSGKLPGADMNVCTMGEWMWWCDRASVKLFMNVIIAWAPGCNMHASAVSM